LTLEAYPLLPYLEGLGHVDVAAVGAGCGAGA
jgi:hypothetical protein